MLQSVRGRAHDDVVDNRPHDIVVLQVGGGKKHEINDRVVSSESERKRTFIAAARAKRRRLCAFITLLSVTRRLM